MRAQCKDSPLAGSHKYPFSQPTSLVRHSVEASSKLRLGRFSTKSNSPNSSNIRAVSMVPISLQFVVFLPLMGPSWVSIPH